MKHNILLASLVENFSTLIFWISILFLIGVFLYRLVIILNQKTSFYDNFEEPVFDNEEEKKLFLLTKYNTLINRTSTSDMEAADKVHKEIYGSPISKPKEIKKRNKNSNNKEQKRVKFNDQPIIKIF